MALGERSECSYGEVQRSETVVDGVSPSDVDITCNNLKKYTSVASRNKIGYVTNTTTKGEHYVRETFLYDEGHIENT